MEKIIEYTEQAMDVKTPENMIEEQGVHGKSQEIPVKLTQLREMIATACGRIHNMQSKKKRNKVDMEYW